MLAADVLSDAVGVDSLTAMDAARNAAVNNRMLTGQEKDWIKARAREQAGADCAAIAGCDLQARTLYWTDLLSAVAAARDDSAEAAKLQAYLGEVGILLTRQGAEGYYGQALSYLADFARAGAMLDAKAGQVIVGADGRAYMGRDGQPQTFFSATEQQWNDHTLNVFPGGVPNAELIAGQSARQQERLSTLRLASGSLESVHWEEMLLVAGPVFKAGASGIREWVAGAGGRASASKVWLDRSLNTADRSLAIDAGDAIMGNPLSAASYGRLVSQGTELRLVNDPLMRDAGFFDGTRNSVTLNLSAHQSADDVASTVVHEATHQSRWFNGHSLGTQYEEYLALRNEFLFGAGRRPTIPERQIIWQKTQETYPALPQGRNPVGGSR